MKRLLWLISCLLITTSALQAQSQRLQVAGSEGHLWALLPDDGGWQLAHAGQRGSGSEYRIIRRFDSKPLVLHALDHTLWLVFSGGSSTAPRLECYRLQAEYQASLELYVMEPREGLDTLPPLRDVDQLSCFVGTASGPILMGTSSLDQRLTAHRLRQGRWEPLTLPESIDASMPLHAVESHRGLLLLQQSGPTTTTWLLGTDQRWTTGVLTDVPTVRELLNVDGQPLLVHEGGSSTIEFAYLQPEGSWPLATRPRPDDAWGVVGQQGAVGLISLHEGLITAEIVDAMSGAAIRLEVFEPTSVLTNGLWSMAIALGLASTVILVIVLAKGGDLSSMVVPSGWSVLPPMRRFWSLAVDLIPGLCVFFFVASGEIRHLVKVPLMNLSAEDLAPYLMLVAVTVVWCITFESTVGWTPGKRLFGACVRTTLGGRPSLRAIVVRNVIKALVLLVPPLAVLAVLHPNQQGLGDLMARTIVVRPVAAPEEDGGSFT
ncbi:MAG: RDD family protein [Phycisphaerales bacterium]|nr:RDD family protein [Phycisphaerales bacterium]